MLRVWRRLVTRTGLIMAILPAHIMRSVAGGYDNESVAMTAMMLTFYCWVRSLREVSSVKDGRATLGSVGFGIATGFAYIYMVATWGGYVFVINMIGAHAAVLVGMGRYTSKLHRAYSLMYVIGTLGAIRVPPVGMQPLKSLEQMQRSTARNVLPPARGSRRGHPPPLAPEAHPLAPG